MTNSARPSPRDTLEEALRQQRPVQLTHHGHQRTVCPHALGWKTGRPMLLAYQTGGHTSTGTLPADPQYRWRCLLVDDIDQVLPAHSATTWQTADNYNPSRPFPAIDEIAVAITIDDPPQAS